MSVNRLSCFLIISSLEDDIRGILTAGLAAAGITTFLPEEDRIMSRKRLAQAKDGGEPASEPDTMLLPFLDFGQLAQLIAANKSHLDIEQQFVTALASELQGLTEVRNRVCHSRPLEFDDFQRLFDCAERLISRDRSLWPSTASAVSTIQQSPNQVLNLVIPSYWRDSDQDIQNNLPVPEFDETGFVGRRHDVEAVRKLILGAFPIISIIGEGGIGKTALALKVLNEILEADVRAKFDAIVWVSLKGFVLTPTGVEEVRGAISGTLGLYTAVAQELGTPDAEHLSLDALLHEILEYMTDFRVLLALDNLESVPQQDILRFLRDIPPQSKVLITSRMGLGQLEHPFPLSAFERGDAARFLRRAAIAQNQVRLSSADQAVVERWCSKLLFNPLAIKWFVASVAYGRAPEDVLNETSSNYQTLLKFSFQNLYASLPHLSKTIIIALYVAGRAATKNEIAFVLESVGEIADPDNIEFAIRTLVNASALVPQEAKAAKDITSYQLSSFAKQFIRSVETVDRKLTLALQKAFQRLKAASEESHRRSEYYAYEYTNIHCENRDQRVVGIKLAKALELGRQRRDAEAAAVVEWAKRMAPNFSEVHRVAGVLASRASDFTEAQEQYELALEVNPRSLIARYALARLYLYDLHDFERAQQNAEVLVKHSGGDVPSRALLAFILSRLGRFSDAAVAYAALLEKPEELSLKYRVSIRDQFIETYRRWADQDMRGQNVLAFKEHIECAFREAEVLAGSPEVSADTEARRRIAEVFGTLYIVAYRMGDIAYADAVTDSHCPLLRFASRLEWPISMLEQYFRKVESESRHSDLLRRIFRVSGRDDRNAVQLSTDDGVEAPRLTGSVMSLPPNKLFGFIEADRGDGRWFFHMYNLRIAADFARLRIGTRISFGIGSNAQGRCAVDCVIAE